MTSLQEQALQAIAAGGGIEGEQIDSTLDAGDAGGVVFQSSSLGGVTAAIAVPLDLAPTAFASASVPGARWRLPVVFISHSMIDCLSMVIVPLLTVLEGHAALSPEQGALLLSVGSISSGLIQPLVAWISDRFNTRIFGPLGLVLAGLAIASLNWCDTFGLLVLVQALTTAGTGAFHPIGAAAAGRLSGRMRSLGLAVFFTFGMIGQTTGSILSPALNRAGGLLELAWLFIPALIIALALMTAVGSIPHRHHRAAEDAGRLSADQRQSRWFNISVLYMGNILRFTVNTALITLVVRWCEWQVQISNNNAPILSDAMRTAASTLNGRYQALVTVGMAIGGLAAGALVKPGLEKWILIGSAAIGAPAIVFLPAVGLPWLAVMLAILCGVGFAAATPISIAVAQRLLPHRTSLASGLMMGGAWMFAAIGPILAQKCIDWYGIFVAFDVVAGVLTAAGVLTVLLSGRLLRETVLSDAAANCC